MHIIQSNGKAYLELFPTQPHTTKEIDISLPLNFPKTDLIVSATEDPSPPLNETRIFRNMRARGTACCLPLQSERFGDILVGIAHDKSAVSSFAFSYLSHFYAFKPSPPFEILAKSDNLCFQWPNDKIEGIENQPFAGKNYHDDLELVSGKIKRVVHKNLKLFRNSFNCPRISFPTGITEKVGDEKVAWISIGMNDCYPQTLAIEKTKIDQLLYDIKDLKLTVN